jgi:hypothetical protein
MHVAICELKFSLSRVLALAQGGEVTVAHLHRLAEDCLDVWSQVLFEYSPEARAQGLELSPLKLPLSKVGVSRGESFFMGLPGLIADALAGGYC